MQLTSQSRCSASNLGLCPPIGLADTLPVSLCLRLHLIALEWLIENWAAASAQDLPERTAATTRPRRSSEYARAMPAGLHPADSLNHHSSDLGTPYESV
jgi:hypothetical protein